MSHTPGPWKAERHDGSGSVIIDTDTPVNCGRLGIAVVRRASNADHEITANASLIAAAPELLAALQIVLIGIESASFDRYARAAMDLAYAEAKKVIAKAKGNAV